MILVLPQLPCKNRYTEDWIKVWVRELSKLGVNFEILGHDVAGSVTKFFTNPEYALRYECFQIKALSQKDCLDKVLCLDGDFPGLLCAAIPTLKLTNPKAKFYTYLHAGSWCNGDIFCGIPGKRQSERAIFDTYDKVFVATDYHKKKIEECFGEKFDNLMVVGFPFYRKDVYAYAKPLPFEEKIGVVINGRLEQSSSNLMEKIKKRFRYTDISVLHAQSRKEYYDLLNKARVVVSLKIEETFGIGAMEAYVLGALVLNPKSYAYPEVMGDEHMLYSDEDDLIKKVGFFLNPLSENFFQNKVSMEQYEQVIPNIVSHIEGDG